MALPVEGTFDAKDILSGHVYRSSSSPTVVAIVLIMLFAIFVALTNDRLIAYDERKD